MRWPVWVIPPAFSEFTNKGLPVFEKTSPIVAYGRRIIWVPQVP